MEKSKCEGRSHCTGVSTFAIRTSQRTDQKLQKSFHLSDPKNEFQNFFPTLQKNKTPDTKTYPTMTVKLNNDNGLQGRWTERQHTTAVLQKWRCSSSYDSDVVNQNLVLRLKFSGENRHLRKAAKRCASF